MVETLPPLAVEASAINPRLLRGFYDEFSGHELLLIRGGLELLPGAPEDREAILGKFQRNEATLLYCRTFGGELAFILFCEVLRHSKTSAHECAFSGAVALKASQTLVATSFPQMERIAAQLGCQSMTFTTDRPGMIRQTLKLGWIEAGKDEDGNTIMKKRLC